MTDENINEKLKERMARAVIRRKISGEEATKKIKLLDILKGESLINYQKELDKFIRSLYHNYVSPTNPPIKPRLTGKVSKRPSSTIPKSIIHCPDPYYKPEDWSRLCEEYSKGNKNYSIPAYCRWCYLYNSCLTPLPEEFNRGLCEGCLDYWLKIGGKKSLLPEPEKNYLRRRDYQRQKESKGKRFCEDCGKEISKGKRLCKDCAWLRENFRQITRGFKEGSMTGLTEEAKRNITRLGGGSTQQFQEHQRELKRLDNLIEMAERQGNEKAVKLLKEQKQKRINRHQGKGVKVKISQEWHSFEYDHARGNGIKESKKDRIIDDNEEMDYDDMEDVDG